jgi:hypothetical protein
MAQKTQTLKNTPQMASEATENENSLSGTNQKAITLRAMARATTSQTTVNKQAFLGDIRQKLAQVADEAKAHGEQAVETEKLADVSATRLYQARIAGVISAEELTAVLGDVFGYKPKQDGTPGKTPAGNGDAIRKRVVRAVQGWDYIHGGDGGRFYEPMDREAVQPVIEKIGRMEGEGEEAHIAEGCSLWSVYKQLGDLKSQGSVRLPFAVDAKKIVGLTESVSETGFFDTLRSNQSLLSAYIGLADQLSILLDTPVDQEPAESEEVEEEGGEELAA